VLDLLLGDGRRILEDLVQPLIKARLIDVNVQFGYQPIEGEIAVDFVVLVDPGHECR